MFNQSQDKIGTIDDLINRSQKSRSLCDSFSRQVSGHRYPPGRGAVGQPPDRRQTDASAGRDEEIAEGIARIQIRA